MTSATSSGSEAVAVMSSNAFMRALTTGWYSVRDSSLLKSSERPAKSVLTPPGSTSLALTPKGLSSKFRDSVMPSTANLVPW